MTLRSSATNRSRRSGHDALASVGLYGDGRLTALSSYDNSVCQVQLEDPFKSSAAVVAKGLPAQPLERLADRSGKHFVPGSISRGSGLGEAHIGVGAQQRHLAASVVVRHRRALRPVGAPGSFKHLSGPIFACQEGAKRAFDDA